MYMKRLARDLWFHIIMIRNMCHYPPELITQLETDVSCLGDSISETDGCLTSPVSICWSWRTDVVPHPSHLPPKIIKKKKLQICSLMVLSSQPKDKNLLKEKVILNHRYLFPPELRCCQLAYCRSVVLQCCLQLPSHLRLRCVRIYYVFCRSTQDSLWHCGGQGNFCLDFTGHFCH